MASGQAAVLAGDNSGYRSVLSDRPALLFDPQDVMALAAKIKTFLVGAGTPADGGGVGRSLQPTV